VAEHEAEVARRDRGAAEDGQGATAPAAPAAVAAAGGGFQGLKVEKNHFSYLTFGRAERLVAEDEAEVARGDRGAAEDGERAAAPAPAAAVAAAGSLESLEIEKNHGVTSLFGRRERLVAEQEAEVARGDRGAAEDGQGATAPAAAAVAAAAGGLESLEVEKNHGVAPFLVNRDD
jgi:hypothetical protein